LCPYLFGIASLGAVICGHIALTHIKRSRGAQGGRAIAMTGLVIGYLELAVVAIFLVVTLYGLATAPTP
jgi:hypothetical protein